MNKKVSKSFIFFIVFTLILTNLFSFSGMHTARAQSTFATDLFFSEYIEGGSNNKALEIFNGTGTDINLSQYTVALYANGATIPGNTQVLSGTLKNGEVYIIANAAAVLEVKDIADIESTVTYFNGDDAVVLYKNYDAITKQGTVIDVIGRVGEDPGSAWISGSVSTMNQTLVRKSSIYSGDTDPSDIFDPAIEWDSHPQDTFGYLGTHEMDGFDDGGSGGDPTEKVTNVTALPVPGEVEAGTLVTLSTSTEGATVYYAVYRVSASNEDVTFTQYDAPIVVDEPLTIKAYAAKESYADSDISEFIYTIKPELAQESISSAKQKTIGTEVIVQGIVTGLIGNNAFIQDETAGLYLYNGGTNISELVVGNIVKVKGVIDEFYSLKQIKTVTLLELVSTGNELPAPATVTIPKITEELESQLVKVENLTIKSIPAPTTNSYSIIATDGTNDITLRVDKYLNPPITLPIEGLNTGDTVTVTAPLGQYNTSYQLMIRTIDDIEKVWQGEDTVPPVINHTPISENHITEDLLINATVTDDREVQSVKLYYRTKGTDTYTIVDMTKSENNYSYTIPKEALTTVGIEYYIVASDGTNLATSPEDINTPYQVTIKEDDITPPEVTNLTPASGSSTGTELRPVISAEYSDASGIDTASIKLYLDNIEVTENAIITETMITYTPATDLTEEEHTVRLEVSDQASTPQTAIVTWNFYVGEKEYNFYFGQLHSHTNLSDGQGTPTEAYTWARDVAKADFFAVTDHSNSFDNDTANENITDISQSTSTEWKYLNQTADSYNKDDEFVAIAGYEMTWSGSWGHINTFNTPWFASRSNSNMDLKAYYNKISQDSASLSQFNHPGSTFGDFADFGFYSQAVDNVVYLLEVGNGEGPVGESGYFPSYEYYTRALDKGWHVAPSNNQDNHKANWVTANEARTVILAPSLTRENVFDAIKSLRVYSTEDRNLQITYKVNDQMMGTVLDNPEKINIQINIDDPDEDDVISKVSIISNGGIVVDSKTFDTNSASWELELNPEYSYYYVRVDQQDEDIAVTAPVWTSEVEAIGISKVNVSQDPTIVDEKVELSAEVYNNGEQPITDITVEFYENEIQETNKIAEAVLTTIETGQTGLAKVDWTPSIVGTYTIYVKATINVGGTDKVYTQSKNITVGNEEDFVKVLVDGGHYNQYVTGNYAGKIETLKEMMKERKHILNINMDELTADDLDGVQLLIITDPQGTDDIKYNILKSLYTDAEIEVIKAFVENGGSLIITSRADYKDGIAEYSNSAQLTPILEAIGTNLRVNDDEIIDNISNGGQSYRLYFDQYVSSKYDLTNDIPEGTTYSFYSGCSVILKEGGSDGAVDWLVKGHETTETLDSDYQGDNIPVQKGNVYAIAAEELVNGAKVIVAGTTFFSDFETASSDNSYSNKQITENILNWIIQEKPVEYKTIAEVRIDEDKDGIPDLMGQTFEIEGRVTSESVAQSEANGRSNAFFDVIYVQDETGGITVFGVSDVELALGTMVRIKGYVDQYDGDAELTVRNQLTDIEVIDTDIMLVQPKVMSTSDSMLEENEGWLVKTQGTVTRMTENTLYIDDGTGEARIYVNGYIGDETGNPETLGKWDPTIKVGDIVSAIGLASQDPEGHRLRVRNTSEIVKINQEEKTINIASIKTTDINGNEANEFGKDEVVVVKVVINNATELDTDCMIIIKLVDSHEREYGLGFIHSSELKALSESSYSLGIRINNNVKKGQHTATVYVWNNWDEKVPLTEVGTFNFTVK